MIDVINMNEVVEEAEHSYFGMGFSPIQVAMRAKEEVARELIELLLQAGRDSFLSRGAFLGIESIHLLMKRATERGMGAHD